jgi:hypothetical protein
MSETCFVLPHMGTQGIPDRLGTTLVGHGPQQFPSEFEFALEGGLGQSAGREIVVVLCFLYKGSNAEQVARPLSPGGTDIISYREAYCSVAPVDGHRPL